MEGENLHAQHRKRFWRNLIIIGLGAAPIGAVMGWGVGNKQGFDAFWTMAPDWLVVSLLTLAVTTLLYGSWRMYRSIDEVELLDNLWSSAASYAAYSILFPVWWVLGKTGITG